MLSFLAGKLSHHGYDWIGVSRRKDRSDETAGMLYDRERFELLEHRVTWLGPPGTEEGSAGWDAALPRTMEMALFKVKVSPLGHPVLLRAVNTHLDHVGVQARTASARQLASAIGLWAEELPEAVQILCGDFNSPKTDNEVYQVLSHAETGLIDAARTSTIRRLGSRSTIHKFHGEHFKEEKGDGTVDLGSSSEDEDEADGRHIDWIFGRSAKTVELRPSAYEVITERLANGRYPSDHFPIRAEFEVIAKPDSRL